MEVRDLTYLFSEYSLRRYRFPRRIRYVYVHQIAGGSCPLRNIASHFALLKRLFNAISLEDKPYVMLLDSINSYRIPRGEMREHGFKRILRHVGLSGIAFELPEMRCKPYVHGNGKIATICGSPDLLLILDGKPLLVDIKAPRANFRADLEPEIKPWQEHRFAQAALYSRLWDFEILPAILVIYELNKSFRIKLFELSREEAESLARKALERVPIAIAVRDLALEYFELSRDDITLIENYLGMVYERLKQGESIFSISVEIPEILRSKLSKPLAGLFRYVCDRIDLDSFYEIPAKFCEIRKLLVK